MTRIALAPEPGAARLEAIGLTEARSFLYHEAQLLDRGRFDLWLELFSDDGLYWAPSSLDQTDPVGVPSIMYENKDILTMRVSRLMHPRTYLTHPQPRTTHLVSNVQLLEPGETGECRVASAFLVHEHCADRDRVFSGLGEHRLRRGPDGGLRIVAKRVDLVNVGGVHAAFLIPF